MLEDRTANFGNWAGPAALGPWRQEDICQVTTPSRHFPRPLYRPHTLAGILMDLPRHSLRSPTLICLVHGRRQSVALAVQFLNLGLSIVGGNTSAHHH
jgi:hypothetical protein